MNDAELKALFHKKTVRNGNEIKKLREQLRIAVNIIRVKVDDPDCLNLVAEMKKCLEETKNYWRGEQITDEDRAMYGLPPKK